jgi:hypothetical protein
VLVRACVSAVFLVKWVFCCGFVQKSDKCVFAYLCRSSGKGACFSENPWKMEGMVFRSAVCVVFLCFAVYLGGCLW